jgi:citrate/tricarballylate utilization protein
MSTDLIQEARRQIEICNACRYCEGFCSVFPAITRQTEFDDGTINHLANLCHNCRGCYYACQYTEPHEFALNVPAALAEVRQDSWERLAWPAPLARTVQQHPMATIAMFVAAFCFLIFVVQMLPPDNGTGFYAYLSHGAMVAIFVPCFLLPLMSIAVSLRTYWREVDGQPIRPSELLNACKSSARLKNLDGGQGQGCNFEQGDRYSNARRYHHQAVMYGFLLCFGATAVATILHYFFAVEAPYSLFSLPKLLGVPGGILLVVGSIGLGWLKIKADKTLSDRRVWGGEISFVLLLGFVALSGLMLYAATGSVLVLPLLAVHLASVLAFFLLTPYSKMVHGFYRFAALIAEEQKKTGP